MLKALFLFKKQQLGSSRIRVLNLLPELLTHGINAEALPWPTTFSAKVVLLSRLPSYDVVILQKKLLPLIDLLLLRKLAKHLIFDFDDAIFIRNDRASDPSCKVRRSRFDRTVSSADLVIAGNHFLANEALRYTNKVTILPSAVEFTGVLTKKWNIDSKPHVIGWVGYGHNLHHLSALEESLRRLSKEYPVELRVVSNSNLHLEGVKVTNIPWTLKGQAEEIAGFDIGVMPLPKNSYTEGKCSYKALQYMAAGVPVVATNWGYNNYVIEDRETGLLADNNEQFYDKLKLLIESPKLAKHIGDGGRAQIKQEFSIEVVGANLAMILKRFYKSQPLVTDG